MPWLGRRVKRLRGSLPLQGALATPREDSSAGRDTQEAGCRWRRRQVGLAGAGPLLGPVSEVDRPGLVPPCHPRMVWSSRGPAPHLGNEAHQDSPYPAGTRLTRLGKDLLRGGHRADALQRQRASTQGSLGGNGRSPGLGTRRG